MNQPQSLPPIYRECRRMLLETEQAVLHFSRYHKYSVGADLRKQAMNIMRRVHRACFDKARQGEHLQALVWQVDDFKISLQLAMEVGAFATSAKGQPRFDAFERLARLASAVGKQCGGWHQASQSQAARGRAAAPGSKSAARPPAHPSSLSACATSGASPCDLENDRGSGVGAHSYTRKGQGATVRAIAKLLGPLCPRAKRGTTPKPVAKICVVALDVSFASRR